MNNEGDYWVKKNWYYHQDLANFYAFHILSRHSILELSSRHSEFKKLLNATRYTKIGGLDTLKKDKYDYVILPDSLAEATDIQRLFHKLKTYVHEDSRIIINYHNFLWLPLLTVAEKLNLKAPNKRINWLNTDDITNLLELEGYQVVKSGKRFLFPYAIDGISDFVNKYIANLPIINSFCITNYLIARPLLKPAKAVKTSVVIPARNEEGNIERAVRELSKFNTIGEIIFIEGHSKDDTWGAIQKVIKKYPKIKIKAYKQDGKGKADAVRKGFDKAQHEILMIWDADLTVNPSEYPKFYNAIASGQGEYINGSRLVYPMEKEAMRTLNILGNKFFSMAFSWLLGQKIKDTLCGTKVLSFKNYQNVKKNRSFFGDFDPFGDYDLIFGASKLDLKFIEIPIRYEARQYGSTNISRFTHGWLLLKMVFFALGKVKFV